MIARGLTLLLLLCVVLSAVQLVRVRHESRQQFVELQKLQAQRDELVERWGQLQLEEATWSTQARVEEIARGKLHMQLPAPNQVVIVTP